MSDFFNMAPDIERTRIQSLFDHAQKHAAEMNRKAVEGSIEIGKEKTQYFEKIALASGGTIALVVSFVGSHAEKMHPGWLLRSALVSLLLAMITAMFRNWKYPFYMFASYLLEQLNADRETERRRADIVQAFGASSISIDDGKPVDVAQSLRELKEVDVLLEKKIAECKKHQTSAFNWVKRAELAALCLIVIGMGMLLVLAWLNF
jgi:CHASE3 domain sensor protein